MPDLTPEEQSELNTLKMLSARVERRGAYSTAFGSELARLNGICARIFKQPEDDAPGYAGDESW